MSRDKRQSRWCLRYTLTRGFILKTIQWHMHTGSWSLVNCWWEGSYEALYRLLMNIDESGCRPYGWPRPWWWSVYPRDTPTRTTRSLTDEHWPARSIWRGGGTCPGGLAKTLGCKLFPIYYNVSCCCVSEYPGNVSVWHLRFFPAFLSALTVPVIYEIMVELRTARWTASLAAALFILGKGLFTLDGLACRRTIHTR